MSDVNKGTPFFYADGPLKGETIWGDFRNTTHHEGGEDFVYRKSVFATICKLENCEYQVFVDVAHVDDITELPTEAIGHLKWRLISGEDTDPKLDLKPSDFELVFNNNKISETAQ